MSHVVSGLLRKAPFTKDGCGQDGQSRMYAIELSEVIKDNRSNEKSYTNYRAAFFAKSDAAKDYYDKAFAEGSFVVVSAEKIKIDSRESNGKNYITLSLESARLEGANFSDKPSQNHQMQAAQSQQVQYGGAPIDMDSEIPFITFGLQYGKHRIYAL